LVAKGDAELLELGAVRERGLKHGHPRRMDGDREPAAVQLLVDFFVVRAFDVLDVKALAGAVGAAPRLAGRAEAATEAGHAKPAWATWAAGATWPGGARAAAEAAARRAAEAGAARAGRTAGTTPEAAGAGRTAGTTRESARPWRSTGTTRAALTAPRVAAGHHPRPLALHR